MESLVELGVLFRDGHLEVNVAFQESPDLWDRLTMALLQVMRFEKYSDSRWLTVGGPPQDSDSMPAARSRLAGRFHPSRPESQRLSHRGLQ